MNKAIIFAFAAILPITGCATQGQPGSIMYALTKPTDEELAQQQLDECLKLGFKPDTSDMANCRLRMKELDAAYEKTGSRR